MVFFKFRPQIPPKKCQLRKCRHVALRAIVAMAMQGELIPPSDSEESVNSENSYIIEDFDPPPVPSDIESESDNDSSDITTNINANSEEPNSYRLEETPIFNYSGDTQDEDDFFSGWKWTCFGTDQDSEPEYGPFLGKQQILFDYRNSDPVLFFKHMFSTAMFDTIAESTNRYANQRLNRTGEYNISIYYSTFFFLRSKLLPLHYILSFLHLKSFTKNTFVTKFWIQIYFPR